MLRTAKILFLNLWFYTVNPLLLVFYLPFGFLFVFVLRLFGGHRAAISFFRRGISGYGRMVTYVGYPCLRVRIKNCPSADSGPYVIIENHCSAFDPFVQGFLPFEVVQAARGWALRFPILGFFARWAGYLDVDGLTADELQEKAKQRLSEGASLVFFPEGTRHDDYRLGAFHGAAFRIALATKRPVLPVLLLGTAECLPKGSFRFRPSNIELVCLEPLKPADFAGDSAFTLKNRIRERIIAGLREHGIDAGGDDFDEEC